MALVSVGRVTGETIGPNKDGAKDVRLLQVEISGPDDVQTVELLTSGGEEINPPLNSLVLVVGVGGAWKFGIAIDDNIVPSMDVGEKKLYSTAAGAIAAFINLLSTGIIELNGNADFAIRYGAMKTAFDLLLSDHNSHQHTETGGTTSAPITPSIADMSGAKVDEVKLP